MLSKRFCDLLKDSKEVLICSEDEVVFMSMDITSTENDGDYIIINGKKDNQIIFKLKDIKEYAEELGAFVVQVNSMTYFISLK